jgi:hypothetical protein
MVANVPFNPVLTSNAAGSFNIESTGYIQGTALDQPAIRNTLVGGILAQTETIPMWGGVGIFEDVPYSTYSSTTPSGVLGPIVGRATTLSAHTTGQLTGFSVFDQAVAMINTPQSPVPLAGSGMTVNYYRLGSGARIPVACDPSLVSLSGGVITQQVSWDFTNQLLIPYLGTLTISSGTYNNTTGLVTLTMSASVTFSAGDAIIVSSLTGTGAYASLNGTFTALTASGTSVTYQAAAALGASTITGGSVTLGSGASVALPCEVLDFNIGNSMTVSYNSTTGFATWNRNGNCAVILI